VSGISGAKTAPRNSGHFNISTVVSLGVYRMITKDFPFVKDLHQISGESFVIMVWSPDSAA